LDWVGADLYRSIATTRSKNLKVHKPWVLKVYLLTRSDEKNLGYGDTTKIWKLYATESEKYDKALVEGWMANTNAILIFVRSTYPTLSLFLLGLYHTRLACSRR